MKWTKSQELAIGARDGLMLVSAAAGSGKTAVLVQRIIDIITDENSPTDIDRFLVVTFTNAAADEMKQRIGKKLDEMLSENPFDENIIRQQMLLGNANISTIHSFCRKLIKEYFYMLDIPSDFRVADEEEVAVIQNNALDEVLERKYSQNDDDFAFLADSFSDSNDDKTLRGTILGLHQFLQSQPFPEVWLKQKLQMYENVDEPGKTIWGRYTIEYAKLYLSFIKHQNELAIKICCSEPDITNAYLESLESDRDVISEFEKILDSLIWDDICEYLEDISSKFIKIGRLTTKSLEVKEKGKVVKDSLRKKYMDGFDKLKKMFSASSEDFINEIYSIKPIANQLFSIVLDFEEEYQKQKADKSVVDYGDLEHLTLKLLVTYTDSGIIKNETAHEVSKWFDYVMVDEYQDTNIIQDIIFNAVSDNDKHLFVVGDVKQSIYSFRQAMPQIFIDRRLKCKKYTDENKTYPGKVNLAANFRSREGITECINYIFSNIMSVKAGGLDYTEDEELKYSATYPEYDSTPAELHLLNMENKSADELIPLEAKYIGELILKMKDTVLVTDEGELRPADFGDFSILLRSAKDKANVYANELLKMNIPTTTEVGDSFFDRPEIRIMRSFLRVLDNPARDIPFASVLMSPIFGFTADEIGAMRAENRGKSLYEILINGQKENEKAKYVCDVLKELRSYGNNVTADELINKIYDKTLLPEIVLSSGEDGDFGRKNLRLLVEYAKKYEKSGFRGISGFVAFLDKLNESDEDLASADRSDKSASQVVRIMTIHKSKGLEFPICIVAGMGTKYNKVDINKRLLTHVDLGIGTEIIGQSGFYRYKGITRTAVENAKTSELISEEMRVLYVALTRAKEKLILVASDKDIEQRIAEARLKLIYENNRVAPASVLFSTGFLDLILYCLLISKSGQSLRDICGYNGELSCNDNSKWDIYIENVSADDDDESKEESQDEPVKEEVTPEYLAKVQKQLEKIKEKLNAHDDYKYKKHREIPLKVTASSLAERESNIEYAASKRPAFMDEGGLNAADRGTALHQFMSFCDFKKAQVSVKGEISRLVTQGFLTEEQAKSIKVNRVQNFLNSGLLNEILDSDYYEREYTFIVEINAGIVDKTLEKPYSDEKVILQGAMDCIYKKGTAITIVDYKTDFAESFDELIKKYQVQLNLYRIAAQQIFNTNDVKCIIYSFGLGTYGECPPIGDF